MNLSRVVFMGCVLAGLSSMPMMARDFYYDIHAGVAQLSIKDGDEGSIYTIGYGVTKTFDNSVVFGVAFDLDAGNIESKKIYGLGGDLKLGYNVWDKLNIYAIGGYKIQDLNGVEGYGFGYGAGVEYSVTEHIVTAVEYKTYHMSGRNYKDYDYDTVGLILKYRF